MYIIALSCFTMFLFYLKGYSDTLSVEIVVVRNKFVVVEIDRATGNVVFVRQRHYAQVLINELCLNNGNTSSLYNNVYEGN